MKKKYFSPFAEKIEFDYFNQIVASGGSECYKTVLLRDDGGICVSEHKEYQWYGNQSK